MVSTFRTLSLAKRGIYNYYFKSPFCISFEVTHSCNSRCKHCNRGGRIKETLISPQELGKICRQIKPLVAQISGGEPLLRDDVEDIVKAFKIPNRAPYIDITTNGFLLTKEKYYKLRNAGVDKFGISLDFPDERQDEFRRIPGLFKHIKSLISELSDEKDNDIIFICVIKSDNFRELIKMAELALEWKVKINFSTYTWLRTNDKNYLISKKDIPELKDIIKKLIEFKRKYRNIYTSDYFFKKMVTFFENESMPNCRTGDRFLNVNPDGTISPCGLIIKDYKSRNELRAKFAKHNNCAYCYTSIRGNTEKSFYYLIKDNIKFKKII